MYYLWHWKIHTSNVADNIFSFEVDASEVNIKNE